MTRRDEHEEGHIVPNTCLLAAFKTYGAGHGGSRHVESACLNVDSRAFKCNGFRVFRTTQFNGIYRGEQGSRQSHFKHGKQITEIERDHSSVSGPVHGTGVHEVDVRQMSQRVGGIECLDRRQADRNLVPVNRGAFLRR